MSAYRLEELGWLGFQRLGELVMGLEGWTGDADRVRELLWEADLAVPGTAAVLDGPVLVQILWRRDRTFLDEWTPPAGARSRLVICNAERVPERMLGVSELSALIDARADLRRRLPSLLGLSDLGPLLDDGAVARGNLDVEGACELARVLRACSSPRARTRGRSTCSTATASSC